MHEPRVAAGPPQQVQNECKRSSRHEGPLLGPLSSKGSGETGESVAAGSIPAASTIFASLFARVFRARHHHTVTLIVTLLAFDGP